jgi:hypothetical protein
MAWAAELIQALDEDVGRGNPAASAIARVLIVRDRAPSEAGAKTMTARSKSNTRSGPEAMEAKPRQVGTHAS